LLAPEGLPQLASLGHLLSRARDHAGWRDRPARQDRSLIGQGSTRCSPRRARIQRGSHLTGLRDPALLRAPVTSPPSEVAFARLAAAAAPLSRSFSPARAASRLPPRRGERSAAPKVPSSRGERRRVSRADSIARAGTNPGEWTRVHRLFPACGVASRRLCYPQVEPPLGQSGDAQRLGVRNGCLARRPRTRPDPQRPQRLLRSGRSAA